MAATTKSTEYAKYDTLGMTSRPDSITAEGRIRFLNDIINTTADNSATDVITLLPLPAGALVDKRRSFIHVETKPAATVTCDLGFTSDPDGICDGANLAVAGIIQMKEGTGALGSDLLAVPKSDPLILTLNTMTTPQIGKVRVSIAYYVR